MPRALGVDIGGRRIGLALSDPEGILATPRRILERVGRTPDKADHVAIVEAARSFGVKTIVVGLPLSMSGATGPAARAVLDEVDDLRELAGDEFVVETHDERLSSVAADRALARTGSRRSGEPNDDAAAAVILQSWLDVNRG
ncbi:MAG: Holliday junction resolvase RuvX [Acidimicrobiia bacterium]|nr:Holliday junction resolvase RuvX [Acidimicrobiia bacterium]